jgi:hypothetical protein
VTWPRAIEAIESSDTDELLRVVDGLCAARDWDRLLELRQRCAEAVTRGKQVWGVEEHIRYRLALEAPAPIAGPVVSEGRSRFGLGPLPEVAASTKTWEEMEPHLADGPDRDTFAAERVVRGDHVEAIPDLSPVLQRWEPSYEVATYKSDGIEAPSPSLPATDEADLPVGPETIGDLASTAALADLVEPWTDQSNGRCQTVAVEGDHLAAVSALGMARARVASLEPAQGLAWMAWAGASGGAHGRRRGAAAGRYLAWWTVATLTDQDWPPADPETMGDEVSGLVWHWFDDGSPESGWVLRLAITSPQLGLSWAVSATDQA